MYELMISHDVEISIFNHICWYLVRVLLKRIEHGIKRWHAHNLREFIGMEGIM